jgi:polysaccharide deacetylase family protein (PEP-CTERM system associated)
MTIPTANAMTVDVEDYFHVSAFDRTVSRASWDTRESRVALNTNRLLDLFEESDVRATFFVLGWVAERFPALVQRIAALGHEVASHGFAHRLVYDQTPDEFREDLRRAKGVIESAAGSRVLGYRAPSFSVTQDSLWALDIVLEEGHVYDASIFPIHHDRYGLPRSRRNAHLLRCAAGRIVEVPASTVRFAGLNLPVGGGAYFRHLPYCWTKWGIQRLNHRERRPAVFYLHPWEIDPGQPRLPVNPVGRLRHYRNLARTEQRLRRLLRDLSFSTVSSVFGLNT